MTESMPSMEMGTLSNSMGNGGNAFATFLLMWFFMIIIMMLPLAIPVVLKLYTLVRQQVSQRVALGLLGIFAISYFLPWMIFGFIVDLIILVGQFNHQFAISQQVSVIAILFVAGVYQFTPLKTSFLSCHQPPLCLKTGGERVRVREAFTMGSRYGISCLGSCWGLMLVLLAVDAMSWIVMGFVAMIILAERVIRWRFPIRHLVGLGLIGIGLVTTMRSLLIG